MEITVSVRDLFARAQEMAEDGMDYVTLSIAEAEPSEGLPAGLMFEAWSQASSFTGIQYDGIDAADTSN